MVITRGSLVLRHSGVVSHRFQPVDRTQSRISGRELFRPRASGESLQSDSSLISPKILDSQFFVLFGPSLFHSDATVLIVVP